MKIVVDVRTLGSNPSGIGFYIFLFLKELRKDDRLKIELITDVAESEQIRFLMDKGMPVTCFGRKIYKSMGVYPYFSFVRKYLSKVQPDLFWEPNNLIPVKLHGFKGKLILTVHDLFPITHPEYFSLAYRGYFNYGIRKTMKYADAVLYVSRETQQTAALEIPLSKSKKTFLSYLIVEPLTSRLVSDEGYFLYIGNLEIRKGTDLLLRAYKDYWEKGGRRFLYLAGKIREDAVLKLLDEIKQELPSIRYLGYVSQEEKEELLSKCSCFVFPSRAEGFGIPPLEAMYYRKPIITSNLSIFEEILQGQVQMFGLEGSGKEQVRKLSTALTGCSLTLTSATQYEQVLGRYRKEVLSERLKEFLLDMEDKSEDSF